MPANESTIIIRAQDEASASLGRIASSIDQLTARLTAGAGLVAGAVASVAASKALFGAVSSSTEAFLEQKEAARGLTESQLEYSKSLQNTLGIQDEVTNRAMHQAKILGVTDEQLTDATTAAIGLAEATGQSLESSMLKVNEAINGNANAWASYLPRLREVETEEEKLAIIQEAAQRGLEHHIDRSDEVTGAIARRRAAMDDLRAAIGRIVGPSTEMADVFTVLIKQATNFADSIADSFGFAEAVERDREAVEGLVGDVEQIGGGILDLSERMTRGIEDFQDSLIGGMDNAGRAIDQTSEKIASVANVAAGSSEGVAGAFNASVENITDNWTEGTSFMERAMVRVVRVTAGSMAGAEVAVTHFGDVWGMVTDTIELSTEIWSNRIENWAVNSVPIGVWAATNIGNAFSDLGDLIATIFSNSLDYIVDYSGAVVEHITNIPSMIAQGMSREEMVDAFRGLTDAIEWDGFTAGFESSITEFPHIFDRVITDREEDLANRIAGAGHKIGAAFNQAFEDNLDFVAGLLDNFKLDGFDFNFDLDANLDQDKETGKKTLAGLQAVESRLLTRGSSEDVMKQQLSVQEKQLRELQAQREWRERQEQRDRAKDFNPGQQQVRFNVVTV